VRAPLVLTLAATLLLPGAAQAAPSGELVLVADRSGYVDVRLPGVRLDFAGARWSTRGTYAVVVATRGADYLGSASYFAAVFPPAGGDNGISAEWTRLRLATTGPATIRVPARGLRGRKTVRLDAVATARRVVPQATGQIHDDITVDIPVPSFLVHGFAVLNATARAVRIDNLCVADADGHGGCGMTSFDQAPEGRRAAGASYYLPAEGLRGSTHAILSTTQLTTDVESDETWHFVALLPTR
jgi:hypothetical protein